jgi:DNA-binding IclR family transcriptional regulator
MGAGMNYPVEATMKTLDIVEALQQNDCTTVTEIAEELDMNKSTAHNHLQTLVEREYLIEKDGEYRLGLKFLSLGGHTRKCMPIYQSAAPEVKRLADETGELANLMVEENGMGVHIKLVKGNRALDLDSFTGIRTHLNTTSLGKAILSQMSETRINEIIEQHGLPATTENTITDRETLLKEIQQIEERGYAIDDGGRIEGLKCIGAPIHIDDDRYAAVSVSAPSSRISTQELKQEIPESVCSAANVIELDISF